MVKNKLVRNAVAVVVALGVIGTIPVFAESYDMEDGHAYNNATSSGGIKCCDAGTINDRSGEYASLYLRTTYQDGQEIIGQEWYRGRYTKILAGIGQKIIIVYIVCTEQVQGKQEIESNYLLAGN